MLAQPCDIEGIRHLARAVEEQAPLQSVFLDPSILSNPFGQKLARQLRKRGVSGVRLSHQLYRDLTLAAEPQGIGVVLRQERTELAHLQVAPQSLWLAVESRCFAKYENLRLAQVIAGSPRGHESFHINPSQPVNPVIEWNRTLLVIVRTPGEQSPAMHSTRSFAILHAAVYDAVNNIDGHFTRRKPTSPNGRRPGFWSD